MTYAPRNPAGVSAFALDELDWDDEIRVFLEERASFSPDAMTGIMMGRTVVAMRARDVQRGLDLLAARPDVDAQKLSGVGRYSEGGYGD